MCVTPSLCKVYIAGLQLKQQCKESLLRISILPGMDVLAERPVCHFSSSMGDAVTLVPSHAAQHACCYTYVLLHEVSM